MTSAKISFIDVNHVNKFLLNLELAKNQECLLQKEDKETNKLSKNILFILNLASKYEYCCHDFFSRLIGEKAICIYNNLKKEIKI